MSKTICGIHTTIGTAHRYLPVVDIKAHTTILATASRTRLTQTFVNSSSINLDEVRYVFPLYDGVSVVAFTCRIGDRTIVGEVKERDKAKQDFENAVASGQQAALLEQALEASDCFMTSVGNIPARAKVEVDITYVGELKHDAEVDGTRFTIPAKILPRYGDYPVSLLPAGPYQADGKMEIVVDVTLPHQCNIKKIQSPSHPISVNLGTTSIAPNAEPTLSKASATLGLDDVGMDKDFVLQLVAKDTGVPTAVLETHPTIPNHRAVMATLVPRFALPTEHPEIVFLVDRSGSMEGNPIKLVRSALRVFLKSIPVGVKFNICSFGSHFSFLWDRSQSYHEETLEKALEHVQSMDSDFGGTNMLSPIKAVIANRYRDLPLEILLLTDGEIWDQHKLFTLLNKEVAEAKKPLRIFTLGIGSGVSHAQIEGVARAGHGFSQTVADGEKMDTKLVRMLKGAMSPHVNDYTLEIKYAAATETPKGVAGSTAKKTDSDDEFELIERVHDCLKIDMGKAEKQPDVATPKKSISLYDPTLDLDKVSESAKEGIKTGKGRYAHLPPVQPPKLLQTPHVIPPLFAFNRTTVYLLMGPECSHRTPKSVVLRGTSDYGSLELEIPIEVLENRDELVHQLAAKKAISELEQGRGWLSYAREKKSSDLLRLEYDSQFDEMVEREAVRLGVQFQVGGKWTSFVAVEKSPPTAIADKEENQEGGDEEATEGYEDVKKEEEDKGSKQAASDDDDEEVELVERDDESASPPRYTDTSASAPTRAPSVPVLPTAPLRAPNRGRHVPPPPPAPGSLMPKRGITVGATYYPESPQEIQRTQSRSIFSIPPQSTAKTNRQGSQDFGNSLPAEQRWTQEGLQMMVDEQQQELQKMSEWLNRIHSQSQMIQQESEEQTGALSVLPVQRRSTLRRLDKDDEMDLRQTLEEASGPRSFSKNGGGPFSSFKASFTTVGQNIFNMRSTTTTPRPAPALGMSSPPGNAPPTNRPMSFSLSATRAQPKSGKESSSLLFAPSRAPPPWQPSKAPPQQTGATNKFYVQEAEDRPRTRPAPKRSTPPTLHTLTASQLLINGASDSEQEDRPRTRPAPERDVPAGLDSSEPIFSSSKAPPSPPPKSKDRYAVQVAEGITNSVGQPSDMKGGYTSPWTALSRLRLRFHRTADRPIPRGSSTTYSGVVTKSQPPMPPVSSYSHSASDQQFDFETIVAYGEDENSASSCSASLATLTPTIGDKEEEKEENKPATQGGKHLYAGLSPMETLIELQTFAGFWQPTTYLADCLGIPLATIQASTLALDIKDHDHDQHQLQCLLATALAIQYFEIKLHDDMDTWELVVDKARSWLLHQLAGDASKTQELLVKAASMLH